MDYKPSIEYPGTLAHRRIRGMSMLVETNGQELILYVIDHKDRNAPRLFKQAKYPAPVFVLSGDWNMDAELAEEWLDERQNSIVDRQREV